MWSLSSVRSRLSSSSLIGINGGFKRLPAVSSGFSTGSGEQDNEMERNSKPQENTTQPTENVSAGDFSPRGLHSLGVAGEGDKAVERNPSSIKDILAHMRSQGNSRGPTANMASQYNSTGPMSNMNHQDGNRGPFSNMNSQDNSRGPNSQDNLSGPATNAFSIFKESLGFSQYNSMGPMSNMNHQDGNRGPFSNMNSQDNSRGPNSQDNLSGPAMNAFSIFKESLRFSGPPRNFNNRRNSRPMDFVKGVLEPDVSLYSMERDAHFVLIQLKRNNTHINVMDAKGDTKFWTASGNKNIGGGGKVTRYAAEATAEYVGRRVREMGLKSVVMRVKGFTHFKKKRQAIMSFKEGYSSSRSDRNPIVFIEDVTRKPHNGCRLPKKRRI